MKLLTQLSNRQFYRRIIASLLAYVLFLNAFVPVTVAGPEGAQVVNGQVSIQQSGSNTAITASDKAIINYSSFDIARPETVQFIQPGSNASVLNRILSANPTNINGTLLANGRVFFVNPAGVYIGDGARINVNQFVASALNVSNSDFINGNYNFAGGNGAVINDGDISAEQVYLIGKQVTNSGNINCPAGYVVMAAGDRVFLGEPGSDIILDVEGTPLSGSADATVLDTGVLNEGTIEAAGGIIALAAAGDIYSQAISNVGTLSTSVDTGAAGQIKLAAAGGEVVNTGTIDASGSEGGQVAMEGARVGQFGTIHADGITGDGGNVDLMASEVVALSPESITTANAGTNGNGGDVIVYSPETALFWTDALIEAKGGTVSGDGGFVEISGIEYVMVNGSVDRRAPHGSAGLLYIDPTDLTINDAGIDDTLWTGDAWADDIGRATSQIDIDTLEAHIALGNTSIDTTTGDGGGYGNITVDAGRDIVDGGSGYSLSLTGADITFTSGVDFSGSGNLDVLASGAVDIDSGINLTGGDFTSAGTTFDNTGTITTNGGDITLTHTGDVTIGAAIDAGTGSVSITSDGAINDAADDALVDIIADVLTLTATGEIGGTSALETTVTSLDASSTSAGDIVINETDGITLSSVDAVNGAITINTGGTTIISNVTASGGGNEDDVTIIASAGDITLDTVSAAGAGDVTIEAGGAITLNNNSISLGIGTLSIKSPSINASNGGNESEIDADGNVSLTGANIGGNFVIDIEGATALTIHDTGVGGINIREQTASTITSTDIIVDNVGYDQINIDYFGDDIIWINNNHQINTTTLDHDFSYTANEGSITDIGTVTIGGTASFTTNNAGDDIYLDTLNVAGSIDINTNGSTGDATLVNATDIELDTLNVGGNLDVTADTGNITDSESGTVTVGGTANFKTSNADNYIYLDALDVVGLIGLNTSGSGGNATIVNDTGINLGTSNVEGNLDVTTATGNIDINGSITAGEAITIHAGTDGTGDITFGSLTTIGAPTITLKAGDGSGPANTAKVDFATNTPSVAAGNTLFTIRQDAAITDTPAHTQFLSDVTGVDLVLQSYDGWITSTTADSWKSISATAYSGITLEGLGNIATGQLDSTNDDILIVSAFSWINAGGAITAENGGITITALWDGITTQALSSGGSGDITLQSAGSITTGRLQSINGDILMSSPGGSITINDVITTENGSITMSALGGHIATQAVSTGTSGGITLQGGGNIMTGELLSANNNILIESTSGGITINGDVTTEKGGGVTMTAPLDIVTRAITTEETFVTTYSNIEIRSTLGNLEINGGLTANGGGVSLISEAGKIYTNDVSDDTLDVPIIGYSDTSGAGINLPFEPGGKTAISITSKDDLKLGTNAVLTAKGEYSISVDDRSAVGFEDSLSSGGDPIDVAIYLRSFRPYPQPSPPIDPSGNVTVGSMVEIAKDGTMVVDAGEKVTFEDKFYESVFNQSHRLEVVSRRSETLNEVITGNRLPYADNPEAIRNWFTPPGSFTGAYALRGKEFFAEILALIDPVPLVAPRPLELEVRDQVEGQDTEALEKLLNELGIGVQPYVTDAYSASLSTDLRLYSAAEKLQRLIPVLEDAGGTRIAGLRAAVAQFFPSLDVLSEEQMDSFAQELTRHKGDGTDYDLAGQCIFALTEYVNILGTDIGWPVEKSVGFVMGRYVPRLTEGDEIRMAVIQIQLQKALGV